jgi:hypothetical protein
MEKLWWESSIFVAASGEWKRCLKHLPVYVNSHYGGENLTSAGGNISSNLCSRMNNNGLRSIIEPVRRTRHQRRDRINSSSKPDHVAYAHRGRGRYTTFVVPEEILLWARLLAGPIWILIPGKSTTIPDRISVYEHFGHKYVSRSSQDDLRIFHGDEFMSTRSATIMSMRELEDSPSSRKERADCRRRWGPGWVRRVIGHKWCYHLLRLEDICLR